MACSNRLSSLWHKGYLMLVNIWHTCRVSVKLATTETGIYLTGGNNQVKEKNKKTIISERIKATFHLLIVLNKTSTFNIHFTVNLTWTMLHNHYVLFPISKVYQMYECACVCMCVRLYDESLHNRKSDRWTSVGNLDKRNMTSTLRGITIWWKLNQCLLKLFILVMPKHW